MKKNFKERGRKRLTSTVGLGGAFLEFFFNGSDRFLAVLDGLLAGTDPFANSLRKRLAMTCKENMQVFGDDMGREYASVRR